MRNSFCGALIYQGGRLQALINQGSTARRGMRALINQGSTVLLLLLVAGAASATPANRISLEHPVTRKHLVISAPLPADWPFATDPSESNDSND